MVRATCVYCGAVLSPAAIEAATRSSRRVIETTSIASLEAVAQTLGQEQPPRRYLVLDTRKAAAGIIAEACSVSLWEARQWQAASRYRLIRITTEPPGGTLESAMRERGVPLLTVAEATVNRLKSPVLVGTVNLAPDPLSCQLRVDEDGPIIRRELPDSEVVLIISAPIRREKVREQASPKVRTDTRMEDAWLVHLHLKGESRPLEIDPRRTGFEGVGSASAHMGTLDLVRRLARKAPHDEGFRNVVPALAPAVDPWSDLEGLGPSSRTGRKKPRPAVLDNVGQFREYSAWRGAIETGQLEGGSELRP